MTKSLEGLAPWLRMMADRTTVIDDKYNRVRWADAVEALTNAPPAETVAAPPAVVVVDEFTAGVNAAAAYIDKLADNYSTEHGMEDPDTGVMEFKRGAKEDYYNGLRELADEVRGIVLDNAKAATPAVVVPTEQIQPATAIASLKQALETK